jgi:hypothetical protein
MTMKSIINGIEYDTEKSRLIDSRLLPDEKSGKLRIEELWMAQGERYFLVRGVLPPILAFPIEVQRKSRSAKAALERYISAADEPADRSSLQEESRHAVRAFIRAQEEHLGPDPGSWEIVLISKRLARIDQLEKTSPIPVESILWSDVCDYLFLRWFHSQPGIASRAATRSCASFPSLYSLRRLATQVPRGKSPSL